MDNQNKNLMLALVLCTAVFLIWQVLFPAPDAPVQESTETAQVTADNTATADAPQITAAPEPVDTEAQSSVDVERATIDTARVTGSISLLGGRIDDLSLKDYNTTLDSNEIVTLLQPVGSEAPYYALHGWAPGGNLSQDDVPGPNTLWSVEGNDTLTETAALSMIWENGKGMTFRRTIEIDENYLFKITQSVENNSSDAHRMFPYGIVARHGTPDVSRLFVLHEGLVRYADKELIEEDYDDIAKFDIDPLEGVPAHAEQVSENGWIGFTDKNWMTTLAPMPGQSFTSVAKYAPNADIYQIETRLPTIDVAAGAQVETTTYLFAGAKEWEVIRSYEKETGIYRFVDSIDWGWFFFLTKPIFQLLHTINLLIGNMGWSILALTLFIKALLFPLAYKSYSSMARMKKLQPEMEKLKAQAGDDREKMQKGMMELYKTNKVNPASGCLPLLLQIPIFFSLYKVIIVTIELRHAPWFGWIRDLSAPDPSSIFNLFGVLPYDVPELGFLQILSLGILPILLGVSMWFQQKLNPAPTEPTQAMILAWLPWVFMFMLGSFASGLVIYWVANNVITFTQQYFIMRAQGQKPDVLGNVLRSLRLRKDEDPS